MAETTSKIKLIFDGSAKGVVAASREAAAAVRSVGTENDRLAGPARKAGLALGEVGIGLAKVGAAGQAMSAALSVGGGAIGALTQLAPAALLLPGALLAGAAAMQTFKLATNGFGDAVGAGLSGDLEAFAEATKKMHPEMAKAAAEVVKFKPKIDDLKKAVQGGFWDQFSVGIKAAGDTYLPLLTKELPKLSTELGNIAKQAVNASSTPFFSGAIRSILNSTTSTFQKMRSSAADVATGIVGIGMVGALYLPKLGKGINDVTKRFKEWVTSVDGQESIEAWIDRALDGFQSLGRTVGNIGSILGSVFKGLGGDMSSPLAKIEELTGKVAEFLRTAEAQEGLKALGDTLRTIGEVVGRVVMTALKELAPTLVALAPVAKEVAVALGDRLVSAIETLGPLIRGIAGAFTAFPGSAGAATVAIVGFVAAVKTLQVANKVTDLLGIGNGIFGIGEKAKGADGKVRGFAGGLGLIKGALAVAAIAAIAVELDKVNVSAAGGADKLGLFEGSLHNIVGAGKMVASLDFGGIFADIGEDIDTMIQRMQAGQSPIGQFFGWLKRQMTEPLPPITFDVNTGPAIGQVDTFIKDVNSRAPQVNINGNTTGAGFALREVLAEIAAGKESVTIDGKPMPAQQALAYVLGVINNSVGTADINGNNQPAGQALADILNRTNGSRANIGVGANTSNANAAVGAFVNRWNGYTITIYSRVQGAFVSSHVGGATGGAVTGGDIVPHFGVGGPVRGPGSGTSDSVPAMLSNGEYVMNAAEVRAAGGFAGMNALSDALRGRTAKAAMRTPPPRAAGSSSGTVVQFVGNTSDALATVIMGMIRQGKIQIKAA